jgi:hypothetical protein
MRFHILMGMRLPKESSHKLLKSVGTDGAGVIPATDVARIRASRDFLSEHEVDDGCGGRKLRNETLWQLTSWFLQ